MAKHRSRWLKIIALGGQRSVNLSPVYTALERARRKKWTFDDCGVILILIYHLELPIVLPWRSNAMLEIWCEEFARGSYQGNTSSGSGTQVCNPYIATPGFRWACLPVLLMGHWTDDMGMHTQNLSIFLYAPHDWHITRLLLWQPGDGQASSWIPRSIQ